MNNMHNKVVAITGAGSGIGRALALNLARRKARLAISDIDAKGLANTGQQCREMGAEVVTSTLDVADREAVYAWAAAVHAHYGEVNVVVNNAGVSLGATVEDMSWEDFQWLMNINFWGVVYGTKAFLPYLRDSGDGHVVNLSSLFGLLSMPMNSAYNAAKFAVRGFTESLSQELRVTGEPVGVTCVHPGGIDTHIASGGRVVANANWGLVSAEESGKHFKRFARTTPEAAAEQIVQAITHQQRRLLIGGDARLFDAVQRLFPTAYQKLTVRLVKKLIAQRKKETLEHEHV